MKRSVLTLGLSAIVLAAVASASAEESAGVEPLDGVYTVCKEKMHWCCGTKLELSNGHATISKWGDDGPWKSNLEGEYSVFSDSLVAELVGTVEIGFTAPRIEPSSEHFKWRVFRKAGLVVLVPEKDLSCPFRSGNPWSPLVKLTQGSEEPPVCAPALESLGNLDFNRPECGWNN